MRLSRNRKILLLGSILCLIGVVIASIAGWWAVALTLIGVLSAGSFALLVISSGRGRTASHSDQADRLDAIAARVTASDERTRAELASVEERLLRRLDKGSAQPPAVP